MDQETVESEQRLRGDTVCGVVDNFAGGTSDEIRHMVADPVRIIAMHVSYQSAALVIVLSHIFGRYSTWGRDVPADFEGKLTMSPGFSKQILSISCLTSN